MTQGEREVVVLCMTQGEREVVVLCMTQGEREVVVLCMRVVGPGQCIRATGEDIHS